eukprot:g56743.t1
MYAVWPSTRWCLDNTTKKYAPEDMSFQVVVSVDFTLSPNTTFANQQTNNASVYFNSSACPGYMPRIYVRTSTKLSQTDYPRVTMVTFNSSDPLTNNSKYNVTFDDLAVGEVATMKTCVQLPEGRSSSIVVQILLPNIWWVIDNTHRLLHGPLTVGNGLEALQDCANINFGAVDTSRFSNKTARGRDYLEVCFLVDIVPQYKSGPTIAQNQQLQAIVKMDYTASLRPWDVSMRGFVAYVYADLVEPTMTLSLAQGGDIQNFTVTITNEGMAPCYDILQVIQVPTWLNEIVGYFPGGVQVSYPSSTTYVTTRIKEANLPYVFHLAWENLVVYGPPVPPANFRYTYSQNYQYTSATPVGKLFSSGSCLGVQGPAPLYTSTSGKSLMSVGGPCGAYVLNQTTASSVEVCQAVQHGLILRLRQLRHVANVSASATVYSRGSTRVAIGEVFDINFDLWMPFGHLPAVSVDVSFGGALVSGRVVVQSASMVSLRPGTTITNPVVIIGAVSDCHSGICGDSDNSLSSARLLIKVTIPNVASNGQGSDLVVSANSTYAAQLTSVDSQMTFTGVESIPRIDFLISPVPTAREGNDIVTYTANFQNDGLATMYSV